MTDVALIGRFARVCLDCEEPATTANRPLGPVADPRKSSSVQCTAEVQFSFPLCIGLRNPKKAQQFVNAVWWVPAAYGGHGRPPEFLQEEGKVYLLSFLSIPFSRAVFTLPFLLCYEAAQLGYLGKCCRPQSQFSCILSR